MISVYSESPIKNYENYEIEIAETHTGNLYLYNIAYDGIPMKKAKSQIADFVFFALIQRLVERTLEIKKVKGLCAGSDANASIILDAFTQKLSEYLNITGNKEEINAIVLNLLKERSILSLEGIIIFRLRDFSLDISAFFDMLFYEYNAQRQYEDFISLVKEYIEIERPKEISLHIVFKNKTFRLYNSKKSDITSVALNKYKRDAALNDGNFNDFLISSLLDYLPKNIIIHIDDKLENGIDGAINKRVIETIKAIFDDKVKICASKDCCDFCGETLVFERLGLD